jgi:hypothetical protein
MKFKHAEQFILLLIAAFLLCGRASAQFIDDFNGPSVKTDRAGITGWAFRTGDGTATMDFRQGGENFGSILVDATTDKRGIWWALIQRKVSDDMDLKLLEKPGHEFRIEARIRVSHAPRRVNLQVKTQRTTDHHSHLLEYDIPDTETWHTISMTTRDFDARPGDMVFGHMALIDWGLEKYRVDVDYIKVNIVNVATAGPDKGDSVPYHPPVPDPKSFAHEVKAAHDSMIDIENADVNLNDWYVRNGEKKINLLTVEGTRYVILRWDLSAFAGKRVADHGLLELTTHSVQRKGEELKDFGIIRVVEILGGDPKWDQKTVTTDSFCHYQSLSRVLNSQMIIDWPVTEGDGGKTYLTISRPVLQRLVDGKTLGIAIKPLGAVNAAFYSMENEAGRNSARLLFTSQKME